MSKKPLHLVPCVTMARTGCAFFVPVSKVQGIRAPTRNDSRWHLLVQMTRSAGLRWYATPLSKEVLMARLEAWDAPALRKGNGPPKGPAA